MKGYGLALFGIAFDTVLNGEVLMTKIGNNTFTEVEIYGRRYLAKVLKIHPCGTLDVELSSGRCYRVSGLSVVKG